MWRARKRLPTLTALRLQVELDGVRAHEVSPAVFGGSKQPDIIAVEFVSNGVDGRGVARASKSRKEKARIRGAHTGCFSATETGCYCCCVSGPLADTPMASPETTSSTRRLRWRPSGVSLEAMG